ncbi:Phosphatidylserine decarboxylase proenzyme [Diplonema papillatum]|nr:Phosphatidylserine decarboxylase proenzyme [Diplonema papillatum]
MDEALNTAWDPILRKYKDGPEPEYEPFRDRFQDHIGPHLMEAGTITGEELRILLRKKPKKSASGVDGWRMAELRELPLPLLNALADVMNLVEATGDWPASMTTALVSMVPKDESQDPLHTRPITVTSAVYRLWACRRLADIVLWQEGWIEEGQKGFRPGHRIEDVLMEIGLEVEDALLDGEPLYGVALDFRKCFDMVPREVVLRLAEDLGLHGRVLKPLRAIYSLLARRFKLPLGVGREFSVTNGILQGCPVSVILINALLSVVMKAVKKEAEGVSPKSYADDATLLSRLSEAALQKGVDIVDEFCTLTGMQLNLEKTIAFSTRQRHQSTLRLRSGNALLRFSKSVTCLGALVSTAKNRKERSDSKRVERAAALAEGLRHAPFRYEKRVRIVQSNVLPAALSGCSFAPVSKVAMKRLTTSVMGLIWGGANPKRAREMVLNFQEKGHLTDPGTCLAYRVTTAFYAACERLPRLLPLMESIRGRYAEGDQPLGPVGLAMRSMEECGHIWEPGPLSRTLRRNGAVFDPLASSPSKRGHEVRADLRTRTWARLMARRPGYQGLERADLERTNAFWKTRECSAHTAKLIRVAIAGGVNTAEFTSRMRQAGAEPQAPSCKHCGSGVTENEQHIYWDCDAYSHIRRREAHAGLMAANRTEWPRCTLEHGVVVPENAHLSRRLQEMMAEILAERAGLEARGWVARNPTTPWSRADAMPAEKFDHPFARIAPAWTWERNKTWGLPTFYALVAWLSDMQWTESGQASMLELAIDFELFSGLSMPLHGNAPKGVRERGNVLRCMMSALDKLAAQQGLGSCMRGERVCPTTSLSFMGISGISGVRPRPRFREAHTGTILEEQVKGSDVGTQCPAYPDWTIGRAARQLTERISPDPQKRGGGQVPRLFAGMPAPAPVPRDGGQTTGGGQLSAEVFEKEFPSNFVRAPPVKEADPYYKSPLGLSKYIVHKTDQPRFRTFASRLAKATAVLAAGVGYLVYRIEASEEGEYVASTNTRYLLRSLPLRALSRGWGRLMESESLPPFALRLYASVFVPDLSDSEYPIEHYKTIQQLFTRQLKPGSRPIADCAFTCPCDGYLVKSGEIHSDKGAQWIDQIKGYRYEVEDLLRFRPQPSPSETKRVYAVFYLAPGNYHRFHVPVDDWKITALNHVYGTLLPVNSLGYKFIDELFCLNERLAICGNWKHGSLCYVAVGAYNVGSIRVTFDRDVQTNLKKQDRIALNSAHTRQHFATVYETPVDPGQKGDELGHFRMGSTVVLVADVPKEWNWKHKQGEVVRMGEALLDTPSASDS